MHVSTQNPRETGAAPAAALHPLETALVGVTALHLCFLPWALGTMHPWSQFCSLMLSIFGLLVALIPRTNTLEELSIIARAPSRLKTLIRTPLFWLGFAHLLYVLLQGLNPSWHYVTDGATWKMEPIDHVEWLPSGMEVPFRQAGPWRALIIWTSFWCLVWSVWIGLRRRKSFRLLLTILALNALALALLSLLERLTGTSRIFWIYPPSNGNFTASFIYPNHAGAYLNLTLVVSVGLALWYQRRAEHQHSKSSPGIFFWLTAVIIALGIMISHSRGAYAGLATLLGSLAGLFAWRRFSRKKANRRSTGVWPMVLLFAAFVSVAFVALRADLAWRRISALAADPGLTWEPRAEARQAATDMFAAKPILGWGAGCFRFGFPIYAQKYPILGYNNPRPLLWEHAHDDWIEFPVEFGLIGLLPLLAAFGCAVTELARRRFWESSLPLLLVLACLITLGHAWVDFVFQNPAVLFTWAILLLTAARWAQDHRQIMDNVVVASSRRAAQNL